MNFFVEEEKIELIKNKHKDLFNWCKCIILAYTELSIQNTKGTIGEISAILHNINPGYVYELQRNLDDKNGRKIAAIIKEIGYENIHLLIKNYESAISTSPTYEVKSAYYG